MDLLSPGEKKMCEPNCELEGQLPRYYVKHPSEVAIVTRCNKTQWASDLPFFWLVVTHACLRIGLACGILIASL